MSMKFPLFFLVSLLAAVLAGCGPIYNTSYTYQAPAGIQGRQCIIQCQQAKTLCQSACSTRNYQCKSMSMQEARYSYREYKYRQRRRGEAIDRDLDDFYNPMGCGGSCGCAPKFNDCYTMCGGQVLVHKKCVAFCGSENQ